MKQATLQIKFDEEKLNAIRQYMGRKDAALDKELEDVMQKLYEKHVPAPVREYIESREVETRAKPKKPARPALSANTNQGGSSQG